QGGVTVGVKGSTAAKGVSVFATNVGTTATTDSWGKATIQAPAGNQILTAKIGSILAVDIPVNVAASATGTTVPAATLVQNTALKVLVVKAGAENIEDVLRKIGFATFDSIEVDALRDSVDVFYGGDSTRALTFLQKYTLVFSNCDGGSESSYKVLARTYGRYMQSGGKIYGGHYNFYNLQEIYAPSYGTDVSSNGDSVDVVEPALAAIIGTPVKWYNAVETLGYYGSFSDLPTTTKVYIRLKGKTVPVVMENFTGGGKYLYTIYHNQDIINDSNLIKIVNYFLYSL
ncbi:MAG: hypothetical protein IAF08_11460, partial [Rhizobacter sp.]|nr:hypothetical protein [Chlorobiales bacterium]